MPKGLKIRAAPMPSQMLPLPPKTAPPPNILAMAKATLPQQATVPKAKDTENATPSQEQATVPKAKDIEKATPSQEQATSPMAKDTEKATPAQKQATAPKARDTEKATLSKEQATAPKGKDTATARQSQEQATVPKAKGTATSAPSQKAVVPEKRATPVIYPVTHVLVQNLREELEVTRRDRDEVSAQNRKLFRLKSSMRRRLELLDAQVMMYRDELKHLQKKCKSEMPEPINPPTAYAPR